MCWGSDTWLGRYPEDTGGEYLTSDGCRGDGGAGDSVASELVYGTRSREGLEARSAT